MRSRISARSEWRNRWLDGRLLLLPLLAFHFWSLLRFPTPFVDEGWLAARAWGFLGTGWPLGTVDWGIFDYYDGYWHYLSWLPSALQVPGLLLWPEPSLLGIRLISLFFGVALLAALYCIAWRIGGPRAAWVSLVVVGFSVPFAHTAHLARIDIAAVTFGYVAVTLTFTNHKHRPLVSFVSGALFSIGLDLHLHLAVLAPPLAMLYLVEYGRRLFRQRDTWAFALGIALGVALYYGMHIFPAPDAYAGLVALAFSETHTPPVFTSDPAIIRDAFGTTGRWLVENYLLLFPLLGLALATAAFRGNTREKRWLHFTLVLLLSCTLLLRNKLTYYTLYLTPALDILLASFLVRLVEARWRHRPLQLASCALCLALLLLHLGFFFSLFRTDSHAVYQAVQTRITQSVQPGDTIMGPQTYWFGVPEHRYFSWEALPYYRRFAGVSLTEALHHFHPDLYILDSSNRVYLHDEPEAGAFLHDFLRLPKAEFDKFLATHAELVDEFEVPLYHTVQVYRIHWEDGGHPAAPRFPLPPRPLLRPTP